MPSAKQKRIKRQKKYAQNKEAVNLYMKEYREKKKNEKEKNYVDKKGPRKIYFQKYYKENKRQYYEENKDAKRQYYVENKNDKRLYYEENKDAKRQKYEENKDTKKKYFKKYYKQKMNQKQYYNKKYYRVQRVKKVCDDKCKHELAQKRKLLHDKYKEKLSMMKKLRCGNISFAKVALKRARKYCIKSRARKCANKSFRYSLSEPKPFAKHQYIQNIKKVVSCDKKFTKELKDIFKTQQSSTYEKMSKWSCRQTIALLAAQRLVNRGIQLRKQYVGALLKAVKKICELDIKTHHDFGEGVHSVSSEPYYYESAYDFDFEPGVMVADSCGQCYYKDMKYVSGKTGGTWKCTAKCKELTQFEVDTVLEFKSYFEKSLRDIMSLLSMCDDDCPYTHHSKICDVNESDVQRKGHSVLCYDGSECKSRLRILRLASCHYPVLRGFLNNVYLARSSHLKILKLDEAFSKGDFKFIMEACRMPIDSIFSNVVEGTQESAAQECELRKPDLELRLQAENNKAIAEYRKAVEDYPKNVCCSCQELHQRKNVTVVKFDNHLGTAVWPLLKQFMLQKNPKAASETHFMCSYCKNLIKKAITLCTEWVASGRNTGRVEWVGLP